MQISFKSAILISQQHASMTDDKNNLLPCIKQTIDTMTDRCTNLYDKKMSNRIGAFLRSCVFDCYNHKICIRTSDALEPDSKYILTGDEAKRARMISDIAKYNHEVLDIKKQKELNKVSIVDQSAKKQIQQKYELRHKQIKKQADNELCSMINSVNSDNTPCLKFILDDKGKVQKIDFYHTKKIAGNFVDSKVEKSMIIN